MVRCSPWGAAPLNKSRRHQTLPFLTVLAPSPSYWVKHKAGPQEPKKLTDWARQMLIQAARWLPNRERLLEIVSKTAPWPPHPDPLRPRGPLGKLEAEAFLGTDLDAEPLDIPALVDRLYLR
jgi:hypothetical protein